MNILQAVVLSVVEGITEFLPISSTGHLILFSKILGVTQTEFVKSFEIFIQVGAVFAITILYSKRLIQDLVVWRKIIFAFIPTALIGFVGYKLIKQFLLGNVVLTVVTLVLGGIGLILFELVIARRKTLYHSLQQIHDSKASFIGTIQAVSIIPGVSRSAASIVGGMLVGLSRHDAIEFSFFLALPTLCAATLLDLTKSNFSFTFEEIVLLFVGFIGASLTAWITVKLFMDYVKRHTLLPFGIYRIILGVLYWLIILKK